MIKAFISHYIPQHGFPKIIRSDNASHFKNKHLELVETQMWLGHKFGSVYHPQSERKVERMNLNLKTKLAKTQATTGLNWVDALSLVLPSIRYLINRTTGFTPFELDHGRPWCPVGPPIPGNTKVMYEMCNHLSTSLSLQAPRAARHDYGDSSAHKSVQIKEAGAPGDGTSQLEQAQLYRRKRLNLAPPFVVCSHLEEP